MKGMERRGKERKGKERRGKERKRKERKEQQIRYFKYCRACVNITLRQDWMS
jgi:hypothetical protein